MKVLVVLGDGMADEPLAELGGKTPLEYARTPNFDRVAREGACGLLRTIPPGFEPGSDIANLSILGYDPKTYYTGRGPIEAASMGVPLGERDVAYRCNLVTVEDGVMVDFSAGHIPGREGSELIRAIAAGSGDVSYYPGVSYRNLLVVPRGEGAVTTPPHDIVGQQIGPHLPSGGDAAVLREWRLALSATASRGIEVHRQQPVGGPRVAAADATTKRAVPARGSEPKKASGIG